MFRLNQIPTMDLLKPSLFLLFSLAFAALFSPLQANAAPPKGVPPVMLSGEHAKRCLVHVGDTFPAVGLPALSSKGEQQSQSIKMLLGQKATVVVFWKGNRPMTKMLLDDVYYDVQKPFTKKGVSVVGIVVKQDASATQKQTAAWKESIPVLLDTDGAAFAKVGTAMLPRVYVLDSKGTILWFDVEYSQATRKELLRTLRLLTPAKN